MTNKTCLSLFYLFLISCASSPKQSTYTLILTYKDLMTMFNLKSEKKSLKKKMMKKHIHMGL